MTHTTGTRAVAAAFAVLLATPATATLAAAAPGPAGAQVTAAAQASAPAALPSVKRRSCGRTIRTVYHSCTFARHVAGVYKKRAGHGYYDATLISANSGNAYYVECDGWDYITCYTDSGRITFRVSRIKR